MALSAQTRKHFFASVLGAIQGAYSHIAIKMEPEEVYNQIIGKGVPDMPRAKPSEKAFHQAIYNEIKANPEECKTIIREVLELTRRMRAQFSTLIEEWESFKEAADKEKDTSCDMELAFYAGALCMLDLCKKLSDSGITEDFGASVIESYCIEIREWYKKKFGDKK